MSQSHRMSLIEATTNVAVGYALAVATQIVVFPWFGLHPSLGENLALEAKPAGLRRASDHHVQSSRDENRLVLRSVGDGGYVVKRTVICASACVALAIFGAGAASAQPAYCPPGLAKKAVPCVPPGQAKKGLRPGDRLPDGSGYVIIRDYDRYGLPRPDDGSRYVRLDNDILRVVVETGRILESVAVLNAILN